MAQYSKDAIEFKTLGKRSVVADFNGGAITSDAGAVLLDKTEEAVGLLARAAASALSITAMRVLSNTRPNS